MCRDCVRVLSVLFSSLLVTLAICWLADSASAAQPKALEIGAATPDFSLRGVDGKTYSLSQLKGKHVVLAWFPKAFTAG